MIYTTADKNYHAAVYRKRGGKTLIKDIALEFVAHALTLYPIKNWRQTQLL